MNRQSSAAATADRSCDRRQLRTGPALMNASTAAVAELATAPGGSPPGAPAGPGPLQIRHLGRAPSVHPQAYVASAAVLSGQ